MFNLLKYDTVHGNKYSVQTPDRTTSTDYSSSITTIGHRVIRLGEVVIEKEGPISMSIITYTYYSHYRLWLL